MLAAIQASAVDRLKKDCFFYYLLRDTDEAAFAGDTVMVVDGSGNEEDNEEKEKQKVASRAAEFGRKRCIPRAWRVFMDGYWSLDHGLWEVSQLVGSSQFIITS